MASDVSLKDEIANALTVVLRDLQKHATREEKESTIKSESDHATKLCIVLEAVFLHGLKKKAFLRKRSGSSIGKSDPKKSPPAPSVWSLFSACTPKDVVSQLSRLAYVTTEIGQCRAWIRLALNDGIMENYVDAMLIDKNLISSWYTGSAFLMDSEQSFSLKTLLQSLSAFHFELAYDSQELNSWPLQSLQLAGLRNPDDDITAADTSTSTTFDPMASFSTLGAALRARDSGTTPPPVETQKTKEGRSHTIAESNLERTNEISPPGAVAVPLKRRSKLKLKSKRLSPIRSRSYSDASLGGRRMSNELFVPAHLNTSNVSAGTPVKDDTFGDLFAKFQPKNHLRQKSQTTVESPSSETDDLSYDLVTRAPRPSLPTRLSLEEEEEEEGDTAELMGFEVITSSSPSPTPQSEPLFSETKLSLLTVLTRERGLDSQGFQCRSCSSPIGMIFGHARVCKYDGRYYCKDCHKEEESLIPARLIYNWDFGKYKVSRAAKEFLDSTADDPQLNLAKANISLYQHVSQLNEIRSLRHQLRAATTYLFTCQSNMWEEFRKKVWGREYLFENPDLYSLSDFLRVQSGTMVAYLKKAVATGVKHIYKCRFCSQKGHICEICNNPKIIYSFEVSSVVQCDVCQTVYHKACKADLLCPKCSRVRGRCTQTETRDQKDEKTAKVT